MTAFNRENMNPDRREHFVYRCYDIDGDLLYVGCTMDLDRRRKEHSSKYGSPWWPLMASTRLTGPFNYDTARQLEREAIRDEWPLWNHNAPNRIALDAINKRILNRWFRLEYEIQGRPAKSEPAWREAKARVERLVPPAPSRNEGRRVTDAELQQAQLAEWSDRADYNAKVRWIERKRKSA